MQSDTIAAISTPLGIGGIGVIRISGSDAFAVAGRIFRANNKKPLSEMAGYTSVLGKIYDTCESESGSGTQTAPYAQQGAMRERQLAARERRLVAEAVDEAVCQIFKAPKSYTGEDVAELSCHGGTWILQRVLRLCLENGARAAEAGEFTKRAFLNGKLKLTEAEAVMDLISAQGQSAAKAALSAKDGAISKSVGEITQVLLTQSAHLAAWADFPDEDLEKLDTAQLSNAIENGIAKIDALLKTYDSGRILRDGISAVIVGKPNVGKSTLMNLLAGYRRSIVTEIAGTTRDVIEDNVRLGDYVLRLSDTAGIRDTTDPIEREGVSISRQRILTAELVLAVFDSSDEFTSDDESLLQELSDKPCIAVINKIDLPQKLDIDRISSKLKRIVTISAKNGGGKDELERQVLDMLGIIPLDTSAAVIANERQRACLVNAKASLIEARFALQSENMLDAVNVCIDFALDELLSLTGERVSDKVVDEVFSRFCVGK